MRRRFPEAGDASVERLCHVWDEVVHRVVTEMIALSDPVEGGLHIDVRADMTLELAQIQIGLCERVVEKRLDGRRIEDIDVAAEREACLGPAGAAAITATARMLHKHAWQPRMAERWLPKSAKAIARAGRSRTPVLAVKRVDKNHFIPRWFIRDNWAVDGKIERWRRVGDGWKSGRRGFGSWGYRRNLYSDRLEAYFSLLEGDAKRPIEMLLDMKPTNGSQSKAFVAFLAIQILRNPRFVKMVERAAPAATADAGYMDDAAMPRKAFETLFANSDLYRRLADPLMRSRWAIVNAREPRFILPDTFGLHEAGPRGLRVIVPLTPTACFVTLPGEEKSKRVVPYRMTIEDALARQISSALVAAAQQEFIAHPEFAIPLDPPPSFGVLIGELAHELAGRVFDEPEGG